MDVHELLKERLRTYQDTFRALVAEDLTAFNVLLRENGLDGLVSFTGS